MKRCTDNYIFYYFYVLKKHSLCLQKFIILEHIGDSCNSVSTNDTKTKTNRMCNMTYYFSKNRNGQVTPLNWS